MKNYIKKCEDNLQNGKKYLQITYMIRTLHPEYTVSPYTSENTTPEQPQDIRKYYTTPKKKETQGAKKLRKRWLIPLIIRKM